MFRMKYDKNLRHHCTIPTIFHVREWFERKFGDICEAHDAAYVLRSGKWKADKMFYKAIWERGPIVLIIPTFLFFNTFGFFYYYTK
jgi:hypothetical protein